MATKKERARKAAYMREWTKNHREHVREQWRLKQEKKFGYKPKPKVPVTRANAECVLLERRTINASGCWLYTGALSTFGHGLIRFKEDPADKKRGKMMAVSRVAAHIWKGMPLDREHQALHNCPGCDNPACFNPDHLFVGTQSDNVKDARRKGTFNQGFRKE